MTQKLTNDIIDQKLIGRNIARAGNYTKFSVKMPWKCLVCDNVWDATPNNVVGTNKHGCSRCSGNGRLSDEIIDQRLVNRNIKRISHYSNSSTKMSWECLDCSYVWDAVSNSVVNTKTETGCPKCAGNDRLTNKKIDLKLDGRPTRRIDDCNGAQNHISWKCLLCEHVWMATPTNVVNNKTDCPVCFGNTKITNIIVDHRLIGRNIKRVSDYINFTTKIMWECLKCANSWTATPGNILFHNKGCPKCNTIGSNEKLMHQLFGENHLDYETHYSIKNIDILERNLIFDAYFPTLKLAIEYNGEQHYSSKKFFSAPNPEECFRKQQERDEHKRDFCKRSGIQLLEIDGRKFYGPSLQEYLSSDLIPLIKYKIESK